jgi:hypothetical protein
MKRGFGMLSGIPGHLRCEDRRRSASIGTYQTPREAGDRQAIC